MDIVKILEIVLKTPDSAFFFTPPFYENSYSYLFVNPSKIILINNKVQLNDSLSEINNLIEKGYSAYSVLNYEAAFLFERKLQRFASVRTPVIKFFLFKEKNVTKFKSGKLELPANDLDSFKISNFKINTTRSEYAEAISTIKKYIKEGDTYQVNYTVKGKFNFNGDLKNLFLTLVRNQSAKYSAFINNGSEIILSLSPELFFEIKGNTILTRPMKGTARRGLDIQSDNKIKYDLLMSEKNRAENVMIVDLLRNDLGRIAKTGSVEVKELFGIEKYESLYQMVSEISADIKKHITFADVIKNIFPCGSITGAPKIRTIEIINEVEKEQRGIYTGAIGFIHRKKKVFNVAIRTIVINKKNKTGQIGLGSGIVWDSSPEKEYEETLLKSKFLTKPDKYFELFESMLFENGRIVLIDEHLERLKTSAAFFLFRFDIDNVRKIIVKYIRKLNSSQNYKIKLCLNKCGRVSLQSSRVQPLPDRIDIIISKKRISTSNRYQYFKTTNRNIYNREHSLYSKKGFFDVLFFNERNELAEGAITNVFIRKDEMYYTPPLKSGILGGIFRKKMLGNSEFFKERTLYYEDLMSADQIVLTNAVRKELKVNRLYHYDGEYRTFT